LCIPISGVEALLSSLGQKAEHAQGRTGERAKIEQHLQGSHVTATVVLGTAGVTLRDILDLAPGDTVRLDQPVDREIRLAVQGVPKFLAVPGVLGRKLAVQLTRTLEEQDRLLDKEVA
jgi:flagellar motor switch protein FliM